MSSAAPAPSYPETHVPGPEHLPAKLEAGMACLRRGVGSTSRQLQEKNGGHQKNAHKSYRGQCDYHAFS